MGRLTFDSRTVVNGSQEAVEQSLAAQQPDSSRIVVLHGDVNEQTVAMTLAQLMYLANVNRKPIHLVISTYGGSVDEMFSLYDAIKFLPCPVHTVGLGKVMSAGVLLLASGEKGKRTIGRSTRVMMHPIAGVAHGNVFEIINESNEQRRVHELMISSLEAETRMKRADIQKVMKAGHDYYFTADEAVKFGIADSIIGQTSAKKV